MKKITISNMGFAEGMTFGMSQNSEDYKQINVRELKNYVKLNKDSILKVMAGLAEDWFYTSDTVYEKGKFLECPDVFSSSHWATPSILVIYNDGKEESFEMWEKGNDPHACDKLFSV